jgi:hypothetical protein
MKTVYYRDFGAVGDGKHDDLSAIASAHTYANRHGLPVRAEEGATYYIASTNTTAEIRTDTDWSGAFFIIDDSALTTKAAQRAHHVFEIAPSETPKSVQAGSSVQKGQTSFALNLSSDVLLILTDDGKKQYIREGKNANSGSSMSDITVVRKDGSVRPGTEVVWDFAAVTSAVAKVMEAEPLTVRGGTFTTIANRQDSSSYFNRGIHVTRTNVVLDSITHLVEGEGKASAPYYGFLNLDECADITVKNCISIHKLYAGPFFKGQGHDFYLENNVSCGGDYALSFHNAYNVRLHRNSVINSGLFSVIYWGGTGNYSMTDNIYYRPAVPQKTNGAMFFIGVTGKIHSEGNVFWSPIKHQTIGGSFVTESRKLIKKSTTLKDWQQITGMDKNGIHADPQFVDIAKGDFRLKPGSPATGKGALVK